MIIMIFSNQLVDCRVDEIHDWLSDLVDHSNQCLDFFNEESSLIHLKSIQTGGQSLQEYPSPIDAIREKFEHCSDDSDCDID
jgi:hypothetical protein